MSPERSGRKDMECLLECVEEAGLNSIDEQETTEESKAVEWGVQTCMLCKAL